MIAIVSTTHGTGHGAETVLVHLLRAWGRSTPSLSVVAPPDSTVARTGQELGLPWIPLASNRDCLPQNVWASLRLRDSLADCSLIHAWQARGFELAWMLSQMLGVPATATLHDHPAARFHGRLRRCIMKQSAVRVRALAVVSHAVAAACREVGYRADIRVVHNGIPDIVPEGPCGHTRDPICIGFAGMQTEMKGFGIIERWIRQRGPSGVCWRLYGDSARDFRGRAQQLVSAYPRRVCVCGRQPTAAILSEIDILVHPSVDFDSLPTMLIEAACAGIPCIATDIGGAREIVEHGTTGFLFSPTEPERGFEFLSRLVADMGLRKGMGTAARTRFAQTFRIEHMVSSYAEFWSAGSVTG